MTPSGKALVVLATLGHVDRDGDLILPGSLLNPRALVSSRQHAVVTKGEDPVGEARLYEKDGRLWGEVEWYPDEA